MAITEDQLDLLRASMRLVNARRPLMSAIFYEKLFEIEPGFRQLFSGNLREQTDKVMFALGAVLGQIHDVEACREMTRDLAIRHVGYGVKDGDYAKAGDAVLATLAEVLKEEWSPELEAAWRSAYDRIATAMVEAAYPKTQAAGQAAMHGLR
jgi:hemoglobin-like flavoprotein